MIDFAAARERLKEMFAPKGIGNPPSSFRASMVGVPCARRLYFARTPETWALQKPFDDLAQYEMNRGVDRESKILKLAMAALAPLGFSDWVFNEPGKARDRRLEFSDVALNINGFVDALAMQDGKQIAFEVKTISTHVFEKLDAALDFKNADDHYLQGYYGQLQAYLYLAALEDGCFILEAKERPGNGQFPLKFIPVTMDVPFLDGVIDRIQIARRGLNEGKPPDPITYTQKGCGRCPFLAVCGNDPRKLPANPNLPPELEENLNREFELKPAAAEYEKVKAKNRDTLKGVETAVVGKFYITGEEKSRTMKPSEGKTSVFWQTKIEEITD